jgi:hypothetical protein
MHRLALLLVPALSSLALAQDLGAPLSETTAPSTQPAPVEAVTQPAPPSSIKPEFAVVNDGDARSMADKFIQGKGWSLGWDINKGWGVWIGTSSLLAADATGLAVSLNAAQLDAKFQFAEYLAGVTATAALSTREKNSAGIAAERERMDALAKTEGGDPIAGAVRDILASAGASSGDASVAWRTRVSTASVTSAQAAIPGMMTVATFVSTDGSGMNGTVAVVIASTPKSRLLANAILRGDAAPIAAADPSRTLKAYLDGLDPVALVYGAGATYRVNEKGELCAIGFGIGSVEGSDPEDVRFAETEATQAATAELRNIAGELVLGNRMLSRVAERTRWVDGTQAAESRKGVQETIGTLARALGMPGVTTVLQKRFRSEMMGDVVCVVRSWNLSTAQAAADLRKAFEEQGGWKGGAGVQPGGSGTGGYNPAPKPKGGVPSGQGGGGIDEP